MSKRMFFLFVAMLSLVAWPVASLKANTNDDISIYVPIAVSDISIIIPAPYNPVGERHYGDFNGDGITDLLVQAINSNDASYIFLGETQGKYVGIHQQWRNGHVGLQWSSNQSTIYINDYNGDGRDDIVVDSNVAGGDSGMLYAGSAGRFDYLHLSWEATQSGGGSQPVVVTGKTEGALSIAQGNTNYSINIAVPPGVSGVEPSISLSYNNTGGNGPLGLGWSIGGLSVIHRCQKTFAQDGKPSGIAFSNEDAFCIDGKRLVPVSGSNGAHLTEYRTETSNYSKIVYLLARNTCQHDLCTKWHFRIW